ncbi:MAG: hypothetical protein KDE32_11250 [Novosphingobium sp.]|nr:hypothetical protein [Novosphingobium sp.]
MAIRNPHRLASAGPTDPDHGFPLWFEDANGVRLALVTAPDPMAPAIGEMPTPTDPVSYPANFPEEAFYYMVEARLEVGGNGVVGRARVIMALEAAFQGNGLPEYASTMAMTPKPHLGVVFARMRVRIDDLVPGARYVIRHPYGETDLFEADDRGRIFETCDLGVAEGNTLRVLVTGEIAPFLTWDAGLPVGYIGDGATEHQVTGGPFRNHVEIAGPGVGQGSAHAVGPDLVRSTLFTVQGRRFGTVPNTTPSGLPDLRINSAEFRISKKEFRIGGTVSPVSFGGQSNVVTVRVNGTVLGDALPDATGAWDFRGAQAGTNPPTPASGSLVQATSRSGQSATASLTVRN